MKNTYYTYAWLREDMTPYYVGKGIRSRAYCPHRRGDTYIPPPPKDRVLFLKKNLTEFDAYKHENYIISILRLKSEGGILINMSYGGEGSSGRVLSEETKEKIRQKNKNKKRTEEHKKLISKQVSQRRWWNNGEIDKHTIECPGDGWVLGRLFTKKYEKYKTKEFAEKSRKNNLGKTVSDETRKKQSAVRKGRKWWNNGIQTKLSYECPGDGWVAGRPGHLLNCPNGGA
jgi:hypothetical protein